MGDIDTLRDRVAAVRREYAALRLDGWGEPGPLDERTGERWDRGHVLGHVAEMLPYWTDQVRDVLAGRQLVGRDEVGDARRRDGIDSGRAAGEDGLLLRVDAGLEGVLALLAEVRETDLDRKVVRHTHEGDQESDLRSQLDALLIGHAEAHLRQLRELQR